MRRFSLSFAYSSPHFIKRSFSIRGIATNLFSLLSQLLIKQLQCISLSLLHKKWKSFFSVISWTHSALTFFSFIVLLFLRNGCKKIIIAYQENLIKLKFSIQSLENSHTYMCDWSFVSSSASFFCWILNRFGLFIET
jgi:hypothetical protein